MPYFDSAKANKVVEFFRHLKHTKGKWHGHPFELLPWQEKPIKEVFGTMKDDGTRQYNFLYMEIPKKNGKSETAAGVALQGLCADDEWQAEVYGCAADRQQASIVYDVAIDMVDQWPALKKQCKPVFSQKRLIYLPTKSYYQVLSAEAFTKHGLNVHRVVFDELHAQPNRELFDVMTKGSGDARSQPLFCVITTSGDDPDRESIGWEIHQKATDILMGNKIDPSFYAVIYGVDLDENRIWTGREFQVVEHLAEKELWRRPEIWTAVNPSIGHTIQEEKVTAAYQSAEGNDSDERLFRWLRLNEWTKYGAAKWLPLEVWDGSSSGIVDPEKLKGCPCYGGLDLSSKTDITALLLVFPPHEDREKWVLLPTFWIPEESMKERVKRDKVNYDKWVKQGFIKTTPGNVIDYAYIRKTISGYNPGGHDHCLRDDYDIQEIGFDPWNAMQIALDLIDDGLTMVEVRQGFKSLSPPMKELEKLLKGQELEHGGNPVLRWMCGNMAVKTDENENIRPVKDKSIERIDGIVALIIALARAVLHEDGRSVYEERGVISV